MADIVLIRPGCTDFDEQQRIQGSLDLPLSERGREQLQGIVERLKTVNLEVIYTGPNEPSCSTGRVIAEALGVPLKVKGGLRNLDQGLWQGLQLEDVRRKYPRVFKQLRESPETICPPQGEMVTEAMDRIREDLAKPLRRRTALGIVASEPLATLIGCVLKSERAEMPKPICGDTSEPVIEILHLEGGRSEGDAGRGRQPVRVETVTRDGGHSGDPTA